MGFNKQRARRKYLHTRHLHLAVAVGFLVFASYLAISSPTFADIFTWTERPVEGSVRTWNSIASSADGTKLAATVYYGYIYTSTDSGATWTPRTGSGFRNWTSIASSYDPATSDGTKLVAVENGGQIYTSTDSGVSWTPRDSARNWTSVTSSSNGTKLAAAVFGGKIYVSTNSGSSWTAKDSNRNWQSITSSADGVKLAAVVTGGYIYTSTNSGSSWTPQASAGTRNWYGITSSSGGDKLAAIDYGGNIYTSTDSGVNWTPQTSAGAKNWNSITSSASGANLAATVDASGYVYTSTNSGATWTEQGGSGTRDWNNIVYSSDGTKLAAVVYSGYIYTSADNGSTWAERTKSTGKDWQSITSSADGVKLAATGLGDFIYTSTDSGVSWTSRAVPSVGSGLADWSSITSSSDGTKLAATAKNGYIYTSTNSGVSWTTVDWIAGGAKVWSGIASSYDPATSDGTKLAATVYGGQIYTSADSGNSWTARDSSRNWKSIASSADGVKLAAVVYGGRIYVSTNSGSSWTAKDSNRNWQSITSSSDGTKLAAVVYGGQIYISTDTNHNTWTPIDYSRNWTSITSSSNGIKLAAVDNGGGYIYTSSDSGANWVAQTQAGQKNWNSIVISSDGTKIVAVPSTGHAYTGLFQVVNGSCGTADTNNQSFHATPTTNLCLLGSPTTVNLSGNLYSWDCTGINGTTASCSADYTPAPACGSAGNGSQYYPAPTANLCGDNSTPSVATSTSGYNAGTQYGWTCTDGVDPAYDQYCSAPINQSGVCGSATGNSFIAGDIATEDNVSSACSVPYILTPPYSTSALVSSMSTSNLQTGTGFVYWYCGALECSATRTAGSCDNPGANCLWKESKNTYCSDDDRADIGNQDCYVPPAVANITSIAIKTAKIITRGKVCPISWTINDIGSTNTRCEIYNVNKKSTDTSGAFKPSATTGIYNFAPTIDSVYRMECWQTDDKANTTVTSNKDVCRINFTMKDVN